MLKTLIPTALLVFSVLALPHKILFPTVTAYSILIAMTTLKWLYSPMNMNPYMINQWMITDEISTPLIIMSAWILPLTTIASQNSLSTEPLPRKRMFLAAATTLQTTLILALTAPDMTMFYIMFETTLIPTLLLITRWGTQTERLGAGMHFLFYTLAGSLPLLIVILNTLEKNNHTVFMLLAMKQQPTVTHHTHIIIWLGFMFALLVKMPLYGAHLWLPKAHVEAPIAGSMVLTTVLLKLGGYGIIRIISILPPTQTPRSLITAPLTTPYPFIVLALWGAVMTSMICLRQPGLKSIITYSSISNTGLVVAAALIQTPWSINSAMLLMITHDLTSSMLFCLANTNYERTHSRTLILTRGMHLALPLMATWWMMASMANMSLPPTINMLGKITTISSAFSWNTTTSILMTLATLLTTAYSLHFLITPLHNELSTLTKVPPTQTREHLLMTLHLAPMAVFTFSPDLTPLTFDLIEEFYLWALGLG
uniref:NADH-ubiquinone oxidoreductase chain 4 n=1 Tax=Tropiocolotes tripolitanus TaxID=930273 RepID=A0A0A1H9U2_9SAUR|nr:NADH dehydrogenase subunit 4 [Tropiocolotes tripolitanus]